jgi:hypothetical protein
LHTSLPILAKYSYKDIGSLKIMDQFCYFLWCSISFRINNKEKILGASKKSHLVLNYSYGR